jgi:hypothetical protein
MKIQKGISNAGSSVVEFVLVLPFVIFSVTTFVLFSALCIKNIHLHYKIYMAERDSFIWSELSHSCDYEDNPLPQPVQEVCP